MKNKSNIDRFLTSKPTIQELGENYALTDDQVAALNAYFKVYPEVRKGREWFKQLSRWLTRDMLDFAHNRSLLELSGVTKMNIESFVIRFGEEDGRRRYENWKKSRASVYEAAYWVRQGLSWDEAKLEVSNRQKELSKRSIACKDKKGGSKFFSSRCVEWHQSLGLTLQQATEAVGNVQKRDINFFIRKYGEEEGTSRYLLSCKRRKDTWKTKDRVEHSKKTAPKTSKVSGQEMEAVLGFIAANSLYDTKCLYGSPDKQFTVDIPEVGTRRYDLVVLDKNSEPSIVVEFHGPLHINFSDFNETMRNSLVMYKGKEMPYKKTYGQVFDNDKIKRKFIEEHYPNALYLVIWNEDLKSERLEIDYLQKRLSDRLSLELLQLRRDRWLLQR